MVFEVVGLTLQKIKYFSAQTSLFTHIPIYLQHGLSCIITEKNQENVKNCTQNI
jgi:hypothetical protein